MRIRHFIGVFTLSTFFASSVWAGNEVIPTGGETGTDSVSTEAPAGPAEASGVQVKKLNVAPSAFNPNMDKVARWDTTSINMYHVDMATFDDTLTYILDRPAMGYEFHVPIAGRVTSGFGKRKLYGRKFHKGLDIDLETGDEIGAAMHGKVRIARYSNGYGNFVVISHDGGMETLYGHLSELWVTEGQEVQAGEIIGLGGSTGQSTGSHLHFEVRIFGEQIDPARILNPETLDAVAPEVHIDASYFDHLHDGHDHAEKATHIVVEEETLESICRMYEMEVETLLELNEMTAEDELVPGTTLKLE